MMIMETYRAAKICPKPAGGQDAGEIPRSRDSHKPRAVAWRERTDGRRGQDSEAQLHGDAGDRETYLNIAQVYERGRRYKESEEAAHARKCCRGSARRRNGVFLLGATTSGRKFFDKPRSSSKKGLAVTQKRSRAELLRLHAGRPGEYGLNGSEGLANRR